MRIVHNKKPLRMDFINCPLVQGLISEADITITPRGRLKAKLLIFRNQTMLRYFFRDILEKHLERFCVGAVISLSHTRCRFDKQGNEVDQRMYVDPVYFCLIGLCQTYLGTEVITHEAGHAGFAYEKRVKKNPWGKVGDFDEERICYPTGRIANAINRFLHDKKLYL